MRAPGSLSTSCYQGGGHDWIDSQDVYRDELGCVFTRACAVCGAMQEALVGADEVPEAAALVKKVRAILHAGGLEELAPVVDRLHALTTAEPWRVPTSA